jgi:hypothetical protein
MRIYFACCKRDEGWRDKIQPMEWRKRSKRVQFNIPRETSKPVLDLLDKKSEMPRRKRGYSASNCSVQTHEHHDIVEIATNFRANLYFTHLRR